MGSLSLERGNLEYFANASWSVPSKLLCVPAGLVVTAAGHRVVCELVEKGEVPRDCCDSPWPWRRLWNKVGASVLRTKHHPQQLPCQSTHPATLPGQGRGRALQHPQKEALSFVAELVYDDTSVFMHVYRHVWCFVWEKEDEEKGSRRKSRAGQSVNVSFVFALPCHRCRR